MIEPKNEQGVVILFQELSREMGYKIKSVQVPFPDAVITDRDGKEYKVEFEYFSSNFNSHKHDPSKCDLIICWTNNMSNPPVDTISLKDYLDWRKQEKNNQIESSLQYWELMIDVYYLMFGISVLVASHDFVMKLGIGSLVFCHLFTRTVRFLYGLRKDK